MFHVLDSLFTCNSFLSPLAGSGICLGSLTTYRQTATMSKTTIALNLTQTANILLDFAA